MNRINCEACLALGMDNVGEHIDLLFFCGGSSMKVRLCYNHSVELFKFGQTYFINKYPADTFQLRVETRKTPERLKNFFVFNSK